MRRPGLDGAVLTIVILTRNEAARLPRCLAAIPAQYPVLVLDSGSDDGTPAIAAAHGCIISTNPWPGFAAQRNFSLRECGITSPWVLFIDADEIYDPGFFDWFERDGRHRDDMDIGQVTSILVFKGQPLHHAPGYPILHPRLVRRDRTCFVPAATGHGETIAADLHQQVIDIPYAHHFFDGDLVGWLRKHVGLAAQEAAARETGSGHVTARRRLAAMVPGPARAIARFLYHYLIRGGFRDGRAGLEYALMYGWYEMTRQLLERLQRP